MDPWLEYWARRMDHPDDPAREVFGELLALAAERAELLTVAWAVSCSVPFPCGQPCCDYVRQARTILAPLLFPEPR